MAIARRWLLFMCVAAVVGGCTKQELEYVEVKRINEPLTEEEVLTLLRIAQSLPGGKLPEFSEVFLPVPQWNPARNLPVSKLLDEQRRYLERRWSTRDMVQPLTKNQPLVRTLRQERMTLEQFVGLALTVGTAMARSVLPPHVDFAQQEEKAKRVLAKLEKDDRPYSSLTPASMFNVSQNARQLTRLFRIRALKKVPAENVQIVQKHWKELSQIFPPQFTTDPLAPLADQLEEKGAPFYELAGSGSDDQLRWDSRHGLVGHDVPDSQLADQSASRPTPFRKPQMEQQGKLPSAAGGNAS